MSLSFSLSLPVIRESTGTKCHTPEAVANELTDLRSAAQECFCVLTLDTKNRIIDKHLITLGILNATLAHPREVFRAAIMDSAAAIVLAHNHPSGDTTPSAEDIKLTRQLVEVGKHVEIHVLDHVIIGRTADSRPDYLSLRETGMVQFT
jgi:DNA repair protein RadC